MKLLLLLLVFLFFWALFKGGDCDPDWYDDEIYLSNQIKSNSPEDRDYGNKSL